MALQPFVSFCQLFSFLNHAQSVWHLDGGSARRKAATYTQNNTNAEETHTDNHALRGIRTRDPSVQAGEDSLYLKLGGHCDRRT
jgi:hypothetical protein